jgi:hypothetical protein
MAWCTTNHRRKRFDCYENRYGEHRHKQRRKRGMSAHRRCMGSLEVSRMRWVRSWAVWYDSAGILLASHTRRFEPMRVSELDPEVFPLGLDPTIGVSRAPHANLKALDLTRVDLLP